MIPFATSYPLKINGLGEKKNYSEKALQLDLHNVSSAVCGLCSEEKRSRFDRAFR